MRFIHTSDWHLGKVLRGRSRHDEHVAVLAEIVELVVSEKIGLVIVAGDVFESASPSSEAQRLAWSTFLAMQAAGAEVVVVSGNHDNSAVFEAVRPVFEAAGITVAGSILRPDEGGVIDLTIQGDPVRIALLPWMSPRQVVKADHLIDLDGAGAGQMYSDRVQRVLAALTADIGNASPAAVEIVVTHAFVRGGVLGGGERDAQTVNEYGISSTAFPAGASYVALGHLHRNQQIPGPCPIWYSGSPIAVDFGEQTDPKGVMIVDASPGLPVKAVHHPLKSARVLRTIEGTLAEIEVQIDDFAGDLLRVVITEPGQAGLADKVRDILPDALEVRVRPVDVALPEYTPVVERQQRTPQESFATYLAEQGIDDGRIVTLFSALLADELDTSNGSN